MKNVKKLDRVQIISAGTIFSLGFLALYQGHQANFHTSSRSIASVVSDVIADQSKGPEEKLLSLISEYSEEKVSEKSSQVEELTKKSAEALQIEMDLFEASLAKRDLNKISEYKENLATLKSSHYQKLGDSQAEIMLLQEAKEHIHQIETKFKDDFYNLPDSDLVKYRDLLSKIEEFKNIEIVAPSISKLQSLEMKFSQFEETIQSMESQLAQIEEAKILKSELEGNQEQLKELRLELAELKCEAQKQKDHEPTATQESFIEDLNNTSQKLALLDRASILDYPYPQLGYNLSSAYDQYSLWGAGRMYSPYFQWQNEAMINGIFQNIWNPYQNFSYSGYLGNGGFNRTQNSPFSSNLPTLNGMMGNAPYIYGNNNSINYYFYDPSLSAQFSNPNNGHRSPSMIGGQAAGAPQGYTAPMQLPGNLLQTSGFEGAPQGMASPAQGGFAF